ncbi:MAG: AzlD domain-containing protein [Treponemataceae bacterium]|nr:AzlD domain-containing protein [Treponemataceae bacterium]
MENTLLFLEYLAVMAGVTYLVRMIPFVLFRKKIQSRFIQSFLYYIPYSVLGAMTFPAIFYSTGNILTALAGCVTALILAWFEKSLIVVALCASGAVFAADCVMKLWG